MNYYSHHIGDYRRDTSHLSLIEHGAYRQLMDMYYLSEEPISLETEVVFRRLCARTNEEKTAIETILKEFFELENGWVHKRCAKEIEAYKGKADIARSNGKLGGRPKKTNVVILDNLEITEAKANHKPLTINQEPLTNINPKAKSQALRPDNVLEEVWQDFIAIRTKVKKPFSETALKIMQREADKAGYTLQQALETCCARGWQGFEAKWVIEKLSASEARIAQMSALTNGMATPKPMQNFWNQSDNQTVEVINVERPRLL